MHYFVFLPPSDNRMVPENATHQQQREQPVLEKPGRRPEDTARANPSWNSSGEDQMVWAMPLRIVQGTSEETIAIPFAIPSGDGH